MPPRSVALPIIVRTPAGQRYSCHSCGACCRDFTVQLRAEDVDRLKKQGWERERGEPVTTTFRGRHFLRQRDDGSCTFLQPDGRCEVHARFGLQEKPVACRFFPFSVVPSASGAIAGLNFACQSVQRSVGEKPESHLADLRAMVADAPELVAPPRSPPSITGWSTARLPAQPGEVEAVLNGALCIVDGHRGARSSQDPSWITALCFFSQSLVNADIPRVRGDRFVELASVLAEHAVQEVALAEADAPRPRDWAFLRGAIHLRIHSPRLESLQSRGWLRSAWSDLRLSRAWSRGRGTVPAFRGLEAISTSPIDFATITADRPVPDAAVAREIDDLLVRWVSARLLGERAWGAGYYGMSAIFGLAALTVDVLAVLWLARLHASVTSATSPLTLEGVQWSVGHVERTAGRVPWLSTAAEPLRLRGLAQNGGLVALARALTPVPAHFTGTPRGQGSR
ncbi:MAG: YkgJ family cysteine cluster protein [Planctomycetota bacterium]|nr:YkgJ family cysteine cluster protein [Planctomycetota bacterium]